MSNPSIEDRVSAVETASIRASNAIAVMQTVFTSLNGKIDGHAATMSAHMESMTKRMDSMDAQMGSVVKRMDSMDALMGSVVKRMDSMDARIDIMGVQMGTMSVKMDTMTKRMDSIDTRMDSIDGRMDSIVTRMDSVDGRIEDLAKSQEEGFAGLQASHAVVADETVGLKAWREEITPKIHKVVEHAENRGIHRH